MTMLWISTLIGACALIGIAALARRIPRGGAHGLLYPTWVLVSSLFALYALFFACADDVYGVYLWIRGEPSADEWYVEASRRSFFAVAIAIGALGLIAAIAIDLSRSMRGAMCTRCLHQLLPTQQVCPECGSPQQKNACSRLDVLCARRPTVGLLLELAGALPTIGLFVAIATALVPVPRLHDYQSMDEIELPENQAHSTYAHLLTGYTIERAWAPWLPWPGLHGRRSMRVRIIMSLRESSAFDRSCWSSLTQPQSDPQDYWDRSIELTDPASFERFLTMICESPMPREVHALCAAGVAADMAGYLHSSWAELEDAMARAQITSLKKTSGRWATNRWLDHPIARDPALRTLVIPSAIGLCAGLIAVWPRKGRA